MKLIRYASDRDGYGDGLELINPFIHHKICYSGWDVTERSNAFLLLQEKLRDGDKIFLPQRVPCELIIL